MAAATSISSGAELARVAPRLSLYEHRAYSELEKLVPPSDLAHDWQQFVASAQTLANNTALLGQYAKVKDQINAKKVFLSSQTTHAQLAAIARANDLTECVHLQ